MHGRLKVRTSEEQAKRKAIEREKKLKIYNYSISNCLLLHKNSNYDETSLKQSQEMLLMNADILTLWNYRKKFIEFFEMNKECEEQKVEKYINELSLTEQCLKQHPKSYSCWHHRRWILTKSNNLGYGDKNKQLSWVSELKLCAIFLEYDERNFHCWRHRSFVLEQGKLSKLDELAFTYEKISSNFSNYSAWHYRSKLIENLYKESPTYFDILTKELNLIEQALFTDPNDQSAWIYEKWLLLEIQRMNIKNLIYEPFDKTIKLEFTKKINLNSKIVQIKLNDCVLNNSDSLLFLNDKDNSTDQSNYWECSLNNLLNDDFNTDMLKQNNMKIEIFLKESGFVYELLLKRDDKNKNYLFTSSVDVNNLNIGLKLLSEHLNNILELSEMEKFNSKWCLQTSVHLMLTISFKDFRSTIFEYLEKLTNHIDIYRKNYYLNLMQKFSDNI